MNKSSNPKLCMANSLAVGSGDKPRKRIHYAANPKIYLGAEDPGFVWSKARFNKMGRAISLIAGDGDHVENCDRHLQSTKLNGPSKSRMHHGNKWWAFEKRASIACRQETHRSRSWACFVSGIEEWRLHDDEVKSKATTKPISKR